MKKITEEDLRNFNKRLDRERKINTIIGCIVLPFIGLGMVLFVIFVKMLPAIPWIAAIAAIYFMFFT